MKLSTLTEGELQDQVQLDQDLEEWWYPRGSQYDQSLFYEEEKKESTHIEGLDPEGATIRSKSTEGSISTMSVVKWSEKVKGPGEKIYFTVCGGLYNKEDKS